MKRPDDQAPAKHPPQPIITDALGTRRFKSNPIVRWLLDAGPVNLNTIALARETPRGDVITVDDRRQLNQLIGYSVSGYGDLQVGDSDPRLPEFDAIAEGSKPSHAEYLRSLAKRIADLDSGPGEAGEYGVGQGDVERLLSIAEFLG